MIQFWKPSRSPIGIELDGRRIYATQFTLASAGASVYAFAEALLPENADEHAVADIIRGLVERRGFVGNTVCLGIPISDLQSDLVDLELAQASLTGDRKPGGGSGGGQKSAVARQNTPTEPIDSDLAVRSLFATASGCDVDAMEVVCWPGLEDMRSVFAVALPHERARLIVEPLNDAGLDVAALGCAATALAEVIRRLDVRPGEVNAVVRAGWDRNLLILLRGSDVIYQRTLDTPGFSADLGGNDTPLHRKLASLGDEIATTLECVPRSFRGLLTEKVLLSGELAEHDHLCEVLRRRLASVEVVCIGGFSPAGSRFDVAAGLSLSEVHR